MIKKIRNKRDNYIPYCEKTFKKDFISWLNSDEFFWEKKLGKILVEYFELNSTVILGWPNLWLQGVLDGGCEEICGYEPNYKLANCFFSDRVKFHILQKDISKPMFVFKIYDSAMSFEIGQIIFPENSEYFVSNLINFSNRYIIISCASPKQEGTGHINLKPREFWIDLFKSREATYCENHVKRVIELWDQTGSYHNYMKRNLMIFEKQ